MRKRRMDPKTLLRGAMPVLYLLSRVVLVLSIVLFLGGIAHPLLLGTLTAVALVATILTGNLIDTPRND